MFQRSYGKRHPGQPPLERNQRSWDLPLSPPAGELSSRSVFSPSPLVEDTEDQKGSKGRKAGRRGSSSAAAARNKTQHAKGSRRGRRKRGDCFSHLFSSPDESNDDENDDDENEEESLGDGKASRQKARHKDDHDELDWDVASEESHGGVSDDSSVLPPKPKQQRVPMKVVTNIAPKRLQQKTAATTSRKPHHAPGALKSIWEIESSANRGGKKRKSRESKKSGPRKSAESDRLDKHSEKPPPPAPSEPAPLCSLQGLRGPWSLDDLDDEDGLF